MVEPQMNIVPVNPGPIFPENSEQYVFSSPRDSAASVDTSEFHGIERAHLTYLFPDQKTHLDTTELTYGPGQGLSDQQQNLMALRHKSGTPYPPDVMAALQPVDEPVIPNLVVAQGAPSAVLSNNDPAPEANNGE